MKSVVKLKKLCVAVVFIFYREDLAQLKYLTLCIKEAIRLHSPVPFISRQLTKEMTINGVTLPVGSNIDLSIYCLHLNPEIWQNPMVNTIN